MTRRRITALLLAICLAMVQTPAAMAAEDRVISAVMRMAGTEGEVAVTSSNGKNIALKDKMKLYSGYHLSTELASYAYVSLDSAKAVKLDEQSKSEVRKSGKKLELLLSCGKLFFDVKAPLKEEETLNVRTSTMVTGIRGTAGVVEVENSQVSVIYLLDGQVELAARDPLSGETRMVRLLAGQKATTMVGAGENGREFARIFITDLTESEIDGFAAIEIAKDQGLQERIRNSTNLDVALIVNTAADKLDQDQREAARRQEVTDNGQNDQEVLAGANVDPVFTGKPLENSQNWNNRSESSEDDDHRDTETGDTPLPPTDPSSEETTVPSSEETTVPSSEETTVPPSEETTVPSSENPDPSDPTVTPPVPEISLEDMNSGNLDQILSDAFASSDEVILAPQVNSSSDQIPAISENITVPGGKTLMVNERVAVDQSARITIEGTLQLNGELQNNGTVDNQSMNTFVVSDGGYFFNSGTFINQGRLVIYGSFIASQGGIAESKFVNQGLVVNHNFFQPVMWGYNETGVDVCNGAFINQGRVENAGCFTISYEGQSNPGAPDQWTNRPDGILLLDYSNEYEGHKESFKNFCAEVMGTELVMTVVEAYPEMATASVSVQKTVSAFQQYSSITLLEPVVIQGDLRIEGDMYINLFLNGNGIVVDGGSIINEGELQIFGGNRGTSELTAMITGKNTGCVIENHNRLVLGDIKLTLKSGGGTETSYGVDNWGSLQIGRRYGADNQIICEFFNENKNGWALANRWDEGAEIRNQSKEAAVRFSAKTQGYTLNRLEGQEGETAVTGGYSLSLVLEPNEILEANGPLTLLEATRSSALRILPGEKKAQKEEAHGKETEEKGTEEEKEVINTTEETVEKDTEVEETTVLGETDSEETESRATDSSASKRLEKNNSRSRKKSSVPKSQTLAVLKEQAWKEDQDDKG